MIDVIIPCYNSHKTLDKTLQSILIQSIKDITNVIIIDDKSDSDYKSIINKYKKYLNIKTIRLRKNCGPGLSREYGLSKTSGKYIVFLDSDDLLFSSNSLEKLYDTIERGFDYINSIEYDQKRNRSFILNGNLHGKIYRREYIINNNIHFNNSRYHEDNYFNNLVILSGAKKYTLRDYTYFYVKNTNSITSNINKYYNIELYLKNMKELYDISIRNNYQKDKLALFLEEKYLYLRRLYHSSSKKGKEKLLELIGKYENELLKFIDLDIKQFKKEIIHYLTNKYLYK